MIESEIKLVNCVVCVLDARAPFSSVNANFDKVLEKKPALYVLNKADLAPVKDVLAWQQRLLGEGKAAVTANSLTGGDANLIVKELLKLNADLIERYRAKGVAKTIRAMVIGMPNTGKSTLINSLAREKKTATGNRPGVTRGKQWVVIDKYIELLDSPGVLYPDFSNQQKAINLALIGSVKDEVVDTLELSLEGIKKLKTLAPNELVKRYNVEDLNAEDIEILNQVGKKRGMFLKGGEVDFEKAAKAFLSDLRKGYLGKIILD
jgi:ribosome biogenesis GTPase A